MNKTHSEAVEKLQEVGRRRAAYHTAIEKATGHSPATLAGLHRAEVKVLALFAGKFAERAAGQAYHDVTENVVVGITSVLDENAAALATLRTAIGGAYNEVCRWRPEDAQELAADVLEDANYHDLSAIVRDHALPIADDGRGSETKRRALAKVSMAISEYLSVSARLGETDEHLSADLTECLARHGSSLVVEAA